MLVTFRTKAFSNITMFGDVAVDLIKLMGLSGTVPSAIEAQDIPDALKRLKSALKVRAATAQNTTVDEDTDESEETPVSLGHRAQPLIELLEAAAKDNAAVMWDT